MRRTIDGRRSGPAPDGRSWEADERPDASGAKAIGSLDENDLRLMRVFRVVAESGGLTAAELRLNMERSTISRSIKTLEARLGGCLCLRGPMGFELTELGENVLKAAVSACDTLDAIRDDLNRARNILTGDLLVGIADNCLTNSACRMAEALAAFGQEAPAVRLHIVVRPPVELARDVMGRQLHMCVKGEFPGDDLVRHDLFHEEFRLYAGHPCTLDALREGTFGLVVRNGDLRSMRLRDRLAVTSEAVGLGLEAVATMVAGGRFVGYLPTHYAEALADRLNLHEVTGAEACRYRTRFYLGFERDRPLTAAGQRLREIVCGVHRV